MAIATYTDLHNYAGIDTGDIANDSYFTTLIARATEIIEDYLNRKIEQASFTEYYQGGKGVIGIKNPPVSSVAGDAPVIYDDPLRVYDSPTLIDSDDYGIDYDNGLFFFDYPLSLGNQNDKITYKGGWGASAIPKAIIQAVLELTFRMFQEGTKKEIGVPSRSLPDGSVTFSIDDLPAQTKFKLKPFIITNG
jgi:hypothetical protein